MIAREKWLSILIGVIAMITTGHELGRAQQATSDKTVVLKGATLIDGAGNVPTSNCVIVIEGDKIKVIGESPLRPITKLMLTCQKAIAATKLMIAGPNRHASRE
jgi:hypothetical protein